jgi:DNA replication protein DnaC
MWRSAREIIGGGEAFARVASAALLVLDDLGREENTKTARAALCSAVSKRYDAKLATAVTTELSMTDLRKRYGRYLTDRLAEDMGNGGGIIDCGCVSMRVDRGV